MIGRILALAAHVTTALTCNVKPKDRKQLIPERLNVQPREQIRMPQAYIRMYLL